jgi:hypothetical protein
MGINYKGSQGRTERALVLQEEEDVVLSKGKGVPQHTYGGARGGGGEDV